MNTTIWKNGEEIDVGEEEYNRLLLTLTNPKPTYCDVIEPRLGFTCTQARGHEGDHIAHGLNLEAFYNRGEIVLTLLATWPRSEAESVYSPQEAHE